MTCSLLAGLLVWLAVPICWFAWWWRYVYSTITRDAAWGQRPAFFGPLMKWTVCGLILGTVAAVLVWFKKPCHTTEDFMLARTLLIFIVSVGVIFFYTVARDGAHAGAFTLRVLVLIFQEAIAMAFIPAALYVVFRLVRLRS